MQTSDDEDVNQARYSRRGLRLLAVTLALVLSLGGASVLGYAMGQQAATQPAAVVAGSPQVEQDVVDQGAPPLPAPVEVPQPAVLGAAEPSAITIPAIGVTSEVHQVGLNPDNTMEVPQGPLYDQAAWYRHSPTPGELGPSVIVGHIDSAEDGPSVFFNLGDLEPGQRVEVERSDGSTATFAVESVRSYPKDQFPTHTVYGDTDHAALRLITCAGSFDREAGRYRDNIVVFARFVSDDASGAEAPVEDDGAPRGENLLNRDQPRADDVVEQAQPREATLTEPDQRGEDDVVERDRPVGENLLERSQGT